MPQNSYYLELRTHYLFVPYFSNERRIRVLLPRDYFHNERHYPVLYMHDGQNVFTVAKRMRVIRGRSFP